MSSEGKHVIDTCVLLYFLLVEQVNLLRALTGDILYAPLSVYDPDERVASSSTICREDLLSEMRQAIRYYESEARESQTDDILLRRISRIDDLFDEGYLTVVEMSEAEAELAARLQSRSGVKGLGPKVPLGAGEAACVAIAWKRDWTIVSDDPDAIMTLSTINGKKGCRYERIRKLLIRAADEGHLSQSQANKIHKYMLDIGYWDSIAPFPQRQ